MSYYLIVTYHDPTAHIFRSQEASSMGSMSPLRDRSRIDMPTLHKSMVRSKIEYYSFLWNSVKIREILKLENVQKSVTILRSTDVDIFSTGTDKRNLTSCPCRDLRVPLRYSCVEDSQQLCGKQHC